MQRRTFLQLGAGSAGLLVLGGAAARVGWARTRAPSIDVPTVDRLVLTSTIDGAYDAALPSGRTGTVMVQRTTGVQPSLVAEHGLGYYLESFRGDERRAVLLDFGNTYPNLSRNYTALKVDAAGVDGLILSHGHGDHYGGFLALAEATPAWAERRLSVVAGGEDTFCRRFSVAQDGTRSGGASLDADEVQARGVGVLLAKDPTVVADHAIASGQIARVTDFESALVGGLPVSASAQAARLEVGAQGSMCGDASHFQPTLAEAAPGDLVPDQFLGEIATAYHVKDRGLVIISSCGHSGIINTVKHVQAVTGIDKVHAVIGGFHLAAASDAVVGKSVDAFKEIQPDYIVPMHCTGFYPAAMMEHALPRHVIESSSGTRFTFGG